MNEVPHPTLAAMRKVELVHQRFAFACGYIPARSKVERGGCTGCGRAMPLRNVRDWPGEGMRIGECRGCGSTLTVLETAAEVQR